MVTGATEVPFASRSRNRRPRLQDSRLPSSPPPIVVLNFLSRLTCGVMSRAGILLRRSVQLPPDSSSLIVRVSIIMWIVRIALDRPYTFVVLALLILILSPLVILETPTDIFPNINIPVVAVGFTYTGLSPEEMEGRITTVYERSLTTLVDNIQHIESTSYDGLAIVKIYLQPNSSIDTANAQVTAASQMMLRQLPPGTQPPLVINFSASSVPILQLGLSGQGLSEQQLNDLGLNFLRTQLVTVPGSVIPYPYGGKQRQVMINLLGQ